jgi:glycosyltransferase involved in cell wall biosynthesis
MRQDDVTTKKKIGFVSSNAWSMYNFRIDVIRYLISQGYEVLVMAADDAYASLLVAEGCVFIPLKFDDQSADPINDIRFFFLLKKLYKQYHPDFLFHYVAKPNIYGSIAAASQNIPSVAVVAGLGYAFAKKNWLYKLVKRLYKIGLKKATEVWFLNNEDVQFFVKEKMASIKNVKVLHGEGVNTDYFSRSGNEENKKENKRFRFLLSTRLLKSKGIGVYADAALILRKKGLEADFELLGFFQHQHPDTLKEQDVNRWHQEGLIIYNGYVKDVRPSLLNADCFVFPSAYFEGVPRCLMEAAAMELPIITSFNRGCKEVVFDNHNGYLCNVNDPFDLADKMERMMEISAAERALMGKNGRALVLSKFKIELVIEAYKKTLDIYLK